MSDLSLIEFVKETVCNDRTLYRRLCDYTSEVDYGNIWEGRRCNSGRGRYPTKWAHTWSDIFIAASEVLNEKQR
jgi:hypothetical protein